tara:strand:- start:7142 stop:7300 length:159 start_codon:yes stop_codon:yes gene_type:complete
MKTILINFGILATITGLVYMAVAIADTSSEKWLCAIISLFVAFNIGWRGDDD